MRSMRSAARRVVCSTVLLVASGCVIQTENVTHSVRGPRYPGYAIEYVSATPKPGSPLTEGELVQLSVSVRYVLQSRDTGIVYLLVRDETGAEVLPPGTAVPIKRGRWQDATITQEIRVPRVLSDLVVTVPVLPEGDTKAYGMLQMRYPVKRPR
jgi:hypothetical protein